MDRTAVSSSAGGGHSEPIPFTPLPQLTHLSHKLEVTEAIIEKEKYHLALTVDFEIVVNGVHQLPTNPPFAVLLYLTTTTSGGASPYRNARPIHTINI